MPTIGRVGEIKEVLRSIPLFSCLAPAHLDEMARSSRKAVFEKGQIVFQVGEVAKEIYFLLSGHVKKVTSSYSGNEKVLDLVFPGQIFGEAELFGGRPYASIGIAIERTTLICIGGDSLLRLMETDSQLSMRILRALASRQVDIECDIAASRLRTGCQRVLDYFISQVGAILPADGETQLVLPTSKQLIASRLGITPETLSRSLRELSSAGLIVVDGKYVMLQNAKIASFNNEAVQAIMPFPTERERRRPAVHVHGDISVPGLAPDNPIAPSSSSSPSRSAIHHRTGSELTHSLRESPASLVRRRR